MGLILLFFVTFKNEEKKSCYNDKYCGSDYDGRSIEIVLHSVSL